MEPVWVDRRDVLAVHDLLLALHGGMAGLRDEDLLESALARAQQSWNYGSPDRVETAAAYTAGIVCDDRFFDGYKRAGFVTGILFLELNGYRFTASEEEAAQAVLSLAAGQMDEIGYTNFLRANVMTG